MDCLDPPLDSTPDGSWICPLCPCGPLPPQEQVGDPAFHSPSSPGPSLASSSRSPHRLDPKPRARSSTKRNSIAQDESEIDGDEPPRMRHKTELGARADNKGRNKTRGKGKGPADVKGKGKARASQTLEEPSPTLKLPPKLRLPMRSRSRSADPPVFPTRKVRLVVRKPRIARDEGERGNEDDSSRHMFEGVLKPEEYSTHNTRVLDTDKTLFSRSRTRAEVCCQA
ncbi:hypothetical protein JB92DRAFT_610731 [Gautieria morchelliformis]|nr:hypothetical protein JB92DRAFT_610731 [Gautieria morchelliformis]